MNIRIARQDRGRRSAVLSRSIAAIFGSYVLSALAAAALARVLPGSERDAAMAAIMLAFLIYPAAAIWAFYSATATRAWAGIAAPALAFGLILLFLQWGA